MNDIELVKDRDSEPSCPKTAEGISLLLNTELLKRMLSYQRIVYLWLFTVNGFKWDKTEKGMTMGAILSQSHIRVTSRVFIWFTPWQESNARVAFWGDPLRTALDCILSKLRVDQSNCTTIKCLVKESKSRHIYKTLKCQCSPWCRHSASVVTWEFRVYPRNEEGQPKETFLHLMHKYVTGVTGHNMCW